LPLESYAFKGDTQLEACLVKDAAHVTKGATGLHVRKIQAALHWLDDARIDQQEITTQTYGTSTASAVLAYKTKRKIINQSYQSTADNIVGKMTIAAMDRELLELDPKPLEVPKSMCKQRGALKGGQYVNDAAYASFLTPEELAALGKIA